MNTTITGIKPMWPHGCTTSSLQLILVMFLLGLFGVSSPSQEDESTASKRTGSEKELFIDVLKRKARSETIADRALAMQKLGRIGFPDLLPVLEQGLQSENRRIRLVALDAIGQIDHPVANQFLERTLFSGARILSARAAEWIKERSPAFGIPLLLDGMDHESEDVRTGSFAALEQWTGFRFGYNAALDSDDRKQSLRRWGRWWRKYQDRPAEEWWRAHIRQAEDKRRSVASIVAATAKLTERRCWSCVPELIELLDHPRGPVRVEALHGLRQITRHRFDGTSDSLHEVARRVRSRWVQWWDTYGSMSRGGWLMQQLELYAVIEAAPLVLVLPDRIRRIVEELSDPELDLSSARLLDLLEASGNQQRYAVQVLRGRTGFRFGTFRTAREEKRKNVFETWRKWLREWGGQPRDKQMLHMIEHGKRAHNRRVAARYFETSRSEQGVRALIRFGLRDPRKSVRQAAITSLTYSTGRRLGYRADADETEREQMVQRWAQWWERQESFFEGRRKQQEE